MNKYTSMSNAIRSVLYKNEKSAADSPNQELPDEEEIVDPDPVDSTEAEPDNMHPRMTVKRRVHKRGDSTVKQHLIRNIRAQQKQKIIDND
jgi:hypothetical protein